uniref:RNA-directed DNA polymerase, eukaryota n=1 Tax=Tanacetum cinerariifolium TaxID=118510 RepID=A0A699IHY7_TANCI|nr:RNA-directed DNA polymerase, eukaryota [Tanacetum cinerariifolium]
MEIEECKDDLLARKRICFKTKQDDNILEKFKIIVQRKVFVIRAKELFVWSPEFKDAKDVVYCLDDKSDKGNENLVNDHAQSVNREEHSSDPFNMYDTLKKRNIETRAEKGGSILEVLDDMIKVGQTMGFTMEGCLKDMESIIGSQGDREVLDKRSLWSFITGLISRWNGESIVMGDFNEVRFERDRLGSIFNAQGANAFNSFILNAGLVEIQLEGYSFTLSHPSASKMSKLDRFLVTDGATPFRLYHSWFNLHVFEQMVSTAWNSIVFDDTNRMVRFKKKLQMLKKEIYSWVADYKQKQLGHLNDIKSKLSDIDKILDQGGMSDDLLFSRMDLMKQMQDIKNNDVRDQMQKAKIQWAIEGDENSKFFHGIVNKKRVHLSIKCIMVYEEWVDDPSRVKDEFRSHFATRFQDLGDYLDDVLSSFRFGVKWRSWIKGSLTSGMASILVNGSPSSEFQFHCGLKQGDILAPYLFILVMESLYLSVSRAVEAGIFSGINVDPSLTISYLFYANDAVPLINLKKSQLLGVGVASDLLTEASVNIGCSVMKTLSSSTPIYTMSLYKVSKSMLNEMESLRRNFFNGMQDDERKITWVKWSKVLASKKYGGLGVSSFYALNRALLFKWVWRFISRDNSLWFRFISAMHGSHILTRSPFHFSTWNAIIREINVLKTQGIDLLSHCKLRVGSGTRTMFWRDTWFGDVPFCSLFPPLYALENEKDSTVAVKMQDSIALSFQKSLGFDWVEGFIQRSRQMGLGIE